MKPNSPWKRRLVSAAFALACVAVAFWIDSARAESGPGLDAPPPEVAAFEDLRLIVRIHQGVNKQWTPEMDLDDGEFVGYHLFTMHPKVIAALCGAKNLACAIVDASQDFADAWNADVVPLNDGMQEIVAGECLVFMPERFTQAPRAWFYLLGHEVAHCTYGSFHAKGGGT